MKKQKKIRLDQAMLIRHLALNLKEAQALIMAGEVRVEGQMADKPDRQINAGDAIQIEKNHPYVSRGAFKIEKAIQELAIDVRGLKVLDVGISTGGFSDCLFQLGAAEICGLDVNISQVDYGLRQNPRLCLLKKNARFLMKEDVPFEPDLIIMDLSFISITKILPVLAVFSKARILSLIKPQFEASRGSVGKGGVVRDREQRLRILLRLKHQIENLDFAVLAWALSGIKGRKGNQEYFFLLQSGKKNSIDDKMISNACEI
ncbi:MAG: TlyA family RNA methyltransferase [Chrysiogenales bacterium]|nr:MAG: TlyA family RNA methyltransferase [Chrysiogenales bacterium]